jgi:hypothetical protein
MFYSVLVDDIRSFVKWGVASGAALSFHCEVPETAPWLKFTVNEPVFRSRIMRSRMAERFWSGTCCIIGLSAPYCARLRPCS